MKNILRVFLSACFLLTATPIYPIGVHSAILTSPAAAGGATSVAYASWDEATELVNDSVVWLMESGASANETGVDNRTVPITGVDLVLTQVGSLAGATGSPPSRLFDGGNDGVTLTTNATNVLANVTNTWTLLIKAEALTDIQAANHGVVQIRDATPDNMIKTVYSGGMIWQVEDSGSLRINSTTTLPIPTTGMVHIAFWGDATYVRCGWVGAAGGSGANGQPTLSSDFPANNRKSYTGTVIWGNGHFSGLKEIMRVGSTFAVGKLYYVLMSDTCLITNDD